MHGAPTAAALGGRLARLRAKHLACAALSTVALVAAAPATPLSVGVASAKSSGARLGSRTLAIGMSGNDVRQLQQLLTRRGFKVSADGRFGPKTRAAVERAQRAYHLSVDGIVGPHTLGALQASAPSSQAPQPPSPTSSAPCASTPGSGSAVTRWSPVVSCVLGLLGQPHTNAYVNDVLIVIQYESGGNPNAINLWDVNARNGDPSRGLMQLIGTNFSYYRSASLPNNIYDPAANIYAALRYAIDRYGSIPGIPGVRSVNAGGRYVPYQARSHRRRGLARRWAKRRSIR
jgi:peptidoglycan hydrolase-like protein with peptidoglycan-binding domain